MGTSSTRPQPINARAFFNAAVAVRFPEKAKAFRRCCGSAIGPMAATLCFAGNAHVKIGCRIVENASEADHP
jgi:hypothetical protein